MGYSQDLCGYLRNIVGYIHGFMGADGIPLGGLPEPDMVFTAGGGCVPAQKILQLIARRFPNAKVFHADLPQVPVEKIRRYHIDYATSEIERVIEFVTETTGRKLDYGSARGDGPSLRPRPAPSGTRS